MSEPSYFDDPEKAEKLRQEALSWVGTRFGEHFQERWEELAAELKAQGRTLDAKGASIDCVGLVQEIFARIGATDPWVFPRSKADYQSHQTGEKVLDWLRGKVDDPQSRKLKEILVELEIPSGVTDPHAETPRDFFKPGDILVMRRQSLFHMPVMIDDDLHFVSALPRLGVMEGTIQDSTFNVHLVAVFRLKP